LKQGIKLPTGGDSVGFGKVGIHERCNPWLGERFPFHDRTPMTAGIPNGEKDGFIFLPGFGQGFMTPGPPINGIISMFAEI